jgi:hypothetical protein
VLIELVGAATLIFAPGSGLLSSSIGPWVVRSARRSMLAKRSSIERSIELCGSDQIEGHRFEYDLISFRNIKCLDTIPILPQID